ncbi:MAG: tRNA (adenosine(37)-N6)-threonylcarbamoyltransferase complex ATPase subunit type 1 TsaE, partial [Patescibacteria group bacterium]|nr:tRNA (adenosine(37)-N6)-threonylcarbamoyltransferase complex ATPase subunit type 1 TsaE [Patescibacteria group bacterium]
QGKITLSHTGCVITKSPKQTMKLAKTLCLKHWKDLQSRPLMFLLIGELGAGKTQFAKGIGRFLQIKQPITSPTFVIAKEYDYERFGVKGRFLHLDTWRLQHLEELRALKLDQQLKPKTIMAVEWANRTLTPLLKLAKKADAKIITLSLKTVSGSSPTHRRIIFDR